jgi:hypothetical protein
MEREIATGWQGLFGILMRPARALDAPQNFLEMDGLELDNTWGSEGEKSMAHQKHNMS